MSKRVVSEIMLILMLTGVYWHTLAFNPILHGATSQSTSGDIVEDYWVRPLSSIVINQSQTWYGDFIINQTDTVIIENCNFTVEDGEIWVYGNLSLYNSTLRIHRNSLLKNIHVYGNFTLCRSTIFGLGVVWAWENSHASIFNSTICFLVARTYSIQIDNSTFEQISFYGAGSYRASISNSQIWYLDLHYNDPWTISLSIADSNITNMDLIFPHSIDLELPRGQIENLSIHDPDEEWNVTISNSFVDMWRVSFPAPDVKLLNSDIEELYLMISSPIEPVNLTLNGGFVEFEHLYFESTNPRYTVNTTISDSTIANYSLHCDRGIFSISNSELKDIVVSNSTFSISNSTVSRIYSTWETYCTTTVTDCQVSTFRLGYCYGSVNLTLNEGYQEYLNFYNEEQVSNVTIVETIVNHWYIFSLGNAEVNIHESTITGSVLYGATGGISTIDGEVRVYNSNITGAVCTNYGSLALVNSTMQTIYSYDNSNVTLIDSTVDTYVTDPTTLKKVNSTISTAIYLSLPIQEMSVSILSDYEVSFPENVRRISKYLHVTTTYDDFFEAQIRIHYNESELIDAGFDETDLGMYHLEESSSSWQVCSIQGVNTTENYVWTNVTHFSYFAIGSRPLGDINGDFKVDILDFPLLMVSYGSRPGDWNWLPNADINGDNTVNHLDLTILWQNIQLKPRDMKIIILWLRYRIYIQ